MARITLLTVLCFASAFDDLHEGDIDDASGSDEVNDPSFGMIVFGDERFNGLSLTDAQ